MSSVKPRMDVALKTGFRRLIYDKKRPPLEPETRAKSRINHLRYPYNYTRESLYRAPRAGKYKWKGKEESHEPTYVRYDDPEPVRPRRDPTLQMAKNFSTRTSTAILDNIHALANQRYIGETPSHTDDELGLYVADILQRAKERSFSASANKPYYLSTSVVGVGDDQESDVQGPDDVYTYESRPYYEGYDVYVPLRTKTPALYGPGDDEDSFIFIPEARTQRKYGGAVSAPLPSWRDSSVLTSAGKQVNNSFFMLTNSGAALHLA